MEGSNGSCHQFSKSLSCSHSETFYYASLFLHRSVPMSLDMGDALACLEGGRAYFWSLGAYLCNFSPQYSLRGACA